MLDKKEIAVKRILLTKDRPQGEIDGNMIVCDDTGRRFRQSPLRSHDFRFSPTVSPYVDRTIIYRKVSIGRWLVPLVVTLAVMGLIWICMR